MKTILVTSDITYIHNNYNDVLESILSDSRKQIVGVVLIKINPWSIFGKILYLYFARCMNLANTLAKNTSSMFFRRKVAILKKYSMPFISVKNINDPLAVSWIQRIRPDMILNMRARCKYGKIILEIPKLACVNVHHGILPSQRGLLCDLYAMENNIATGFTIHEMTDKIDQGKIFYQEKVNAKKDYVRYLKKVSEKESLAIVNFINKVAQDNSLPEGILIECNNPSITTTPNFKTIRRLRKNKIIL